MISGRVLFPGGCFAEARRWLFEEKACSLASAKHPPAQTINNSFTDNYLDKQRIQECTVSGIQTRTYTGQPIIQDISIKDGDTQLSEDLDYTVEYKDNVKAGTATVMITGTGTYTGTVEKTFDIKPKTITPAVSLSKTAFVYNGKVQKPVVTVKDGTTEIATSDYTLTYSSGLKNTGTYKIIVDLKGNYTGSRTVSYKITARKITPAVSLSKATFVYNGKVQKPVVTVKDGTTKLTASDYTLTYSSGLKNTGTYKIIVRLKKNYTGTKTVSYKITARKITPTVSLSKSAFVYNGKAQKPAVTVKAGNTKLTTADYTLSFSSGRINAGNYKIIVRLKRNYSGTKTVSYKINPKKVTPTVTLSKTRFTYNGKIQKPVVTVKAGKEKLAPTRYSLTFSKGLKNVGTYRVLVRLKGNYSGTKTLSYQINPWGTSIRTAIGSYNQIKVTWGKKAKEVSGYQIQYCPNAKFASQNRTITVNGSAATTKTFTKPAAGKEYCVRIRTFKKVGNKTYYSTWSGSAYTAVKQNIKKSSTVTLDNPTSDYYGEEKKQTKIKFTFTTRNSMVFVMPIKATPSYVINGGFRIMLENNAGKRLQNDFVSIEDFYEDDDHLKYDGWFWNDDMILPPGTYTYTIKNESDGEIKITYSLLGYLKTAATAAIKKNVSVRSGYWIKIGKIGEGCPLIKKVDCSDWNIISDFDYDADGTVWAYGEKKGSGKISVTLMNGKKYTCNISVTAGNPNFFAYVTDYNTRDNYFEVKVKNLRPSPVAIIKKGARVEEDDYRYYDRNIKPHDSVVVKSGETKYIRFYIDGDLTWPDYKDFTLCAKFTYEGITYDWHVWGGGTSYKKNGDWYNTYWSSYDQDYDYWY